MNVRKIRSICCILWASIVIWTQSGTSVSAAENVWSVEYLNSRKAEWDQLLGAPLRVEGRVSLHGRGQLKLAKCDVPFIAGDAAIRSLVGKGAVELSGRFKKDRDNGKLFFDVDRIEMLSSDVEQYDSRSAKLKNPRAEDWYTLGDWAFERSRFYDDAELARKSLSAYEHGVTAAWRGLAADDAKGRFELAGKITRYKLPDARRLELMHEGYRILWLAALKTRQNDPDAWKQLASQMANDLPGCKQPLAKAPTDLKDRYESEPLTVYRDSPDDVRRQLHRLFYISVLLKPLLNEAEPDGRNGDVIADRIEQQIPEAKAIADQYRNQKLSWRLDRAATATRGEIEQLATEFRLRRQPDLARQALQAWLQAREPRLREDGTLGLLQLAEEYLTLLGDESKAVRILIDAQKLDPTFKDVTQKLNSLGYSLVGGTWVKGVPVQAEATTIPSNEPPPGGITIGMTASQLKAAMGGRPGSITRVYTKQGVSEVWSYLPVGTSRLIIRLERSSLAAEATVVAVQSAR